MSTQNISLTHQHIRKGTTVAVQIQVFTIDGMDLKKIRNFKYLRRQICDTDSDSSVLFINLCKARELHASVCTASFVWSQGKMLTQLLEEKTMLNLIMVKELKANDVGYIGECPMYCKCPNGPDHLQDQELINQLHRSRHETLNNRFKTYGCMKQNFRHDIKKHGQCFELIAFTCSIIN